MNCILDGRRSPNIAYTIFIIIIKKVCNICPTNSNPRIQPTQILANKSTNRATRTRTRASRG